MNDEVNDSTGTAGRRLTGGRAIAQALADNGVTDLFGVHGYINPVLEEACTLGLNMWHFRHEQAAGFAADAYGRTTKRPGVCFASASAGMANYLSSLSQGIGAHSPIVLLVGQHGTAGDELGTLQEGYAAECFKSVAKWTHRLTDWQMNSYWVQKALVDAVAYPPGPVVLEIPVNNQWSFGDEPQRKYRNHDGLPAIPLTQGDPQRVRHAAELLAGAERPLIVAGDGVHWSDGSDELQELASFLGAPTGARRTARGAIPETHEFAYSSSYRKPLMNDADVVALIGIRAGELESWFEPPDWPTDKTFIQIQEVPDELWHALPSDETIVGASSLVMRQLLDELATIEGSGADSRTAWKDRLEEVRGIAKERAEKSRAMVSATKPIDTAELAFAIADCIDDDATIIYDSYQGSLYLTDAVRATFSGQILDAGPRVALGQGVGMCFGAAVARPGKQVITLVGDGGIGLAGMDIETFARYDIPSVFVILNNSSWGGNSLTQSELQPGIGSWDMMQDIRYDEMFAPLGVHTEHVEESADLRPALTRALQSGKPAVVNVIADAAGTAVSLPWLRLKTGEFYSRGIDDLSPAILKHFQAVSPTEALRLHKMAADNGTTIPMSFIAELTGHGEDELIELSERLDYRLKA